MPLLALAFTIFSIRRFERRLGGGLISASDHEEIALLRGRISSLSVRIEALEKLLVRKDRLIREMLAELQRLGESSE